MLKYLTVKYPSGPSIQQCYSMRLELLLLPEKHRETNNRTVDKETANDRHDHRWYLDGAAVRENGREC